ncbi:MAG: SdpI family protein [Phycisphaerae bacterium]
MISRVHLIIMCGLILVGLAIGAGFYPALPNPAPMHWNWRGEVDGYGPPWVAAFLMPLVGIGITLLLCGLPLLGPFRQNFARIGATYGRIGVLLIATFVALHVVVLLESTGRGVGIGNAIALVLGVLFACLGNWMGKIRRNFYLGIRTPWTLANDLVWERTHRVGGRVFVAVGLATIVCALLGPQWLCAVVLLGGAVGAAVWAFVYSAVLYRRLGAVEHL